MPLPSVKYDLNLGTNNAKSPNDLASGQLVVADGIYYKRGSDEAFMKSGRSIFNSTMLGVPGGVYYSEFTNGPDQIVVRAGSNLVHTTAGLTGSYTYDSTALPTNATGLWGAFHSERYYFNDGVSDPWTFGYIIDPSDPTGDTKTLQYRLAGMRAPTVQPTLAILQSGVDEIVLTATTASTLSRDPTILEPFLNPANVIDSSTDTYGSSTISTPTHVSGVRVSGFSGTGSGSSSEWYASVNLSMSVEGGARYTTILEYSIDSGSNWTTFATYRNVTLPATTAMQPIPGTVNSATVQLRATHRAHGTSTDSTTLSTATTDSGSSTMRVYNMQLFQPGGVGSTANTLTTGVYYWVTEYIDYLGIESAGGPVSALSGTCSSAAAIRVTLPSSTQNSATTHYRIYRTVDGGEYPTGTLAGSIAKGSAYFFDRGPLDQLSSTDTYSILTVAGILYERDLIPPRATVMTTFQNCLVVAPSEYPDKIAYSESGFPESFPTLNVITLGSTRDDTVMGLAPLSTVLGVFTRGRGRRIDHLPNASDPSFGVTPEDFAPDHGLESRNGWAYLTPPSGINSHIAYVARDGIRVTDLYTSSIVTNAIDWAGTVDVSRLSESYLINNSAASRLEFLFAPTTTFLTAHGWPSGSLGAMWLHYQLTDNYNPSAMRATFHPCTVTSMATFPYQGLDYTLLLGSSGILYIDEVGTVDYTYSYNASGDVLRIIKTGQVYGDATSRLSRSNIERLVLDTDSTTFTYSVTVTGGRDDTGSSWSVSRSYVPTGGAKPLWINTSGQWHQITVTATSNNLVPARIRNVSWSLADMGEFK